MAALKREKEIRGRSVRQGHQRRRAILHKMDITSVLSCLGLSQTQTHAVLKVPPSIASQLRARAEELLRLSNSKLRIGALGSGDCCRAACCVQLACESLNVSFDRRKIVLSSGAKEKVYARVVAAIRSVLGLRAELKGENDPVGIQSRWRAGAGVVVVGGADVRSLAVRFGCVRSITAATKLLAVYKDRFLANLRSDVERKNADFNGSGVYAAAAVYITGKLMVSLARPRLCIF